MAVKGLMRCVVALCLAQSVLASCSARSCSSCASETIMGFSCRWCPKDSSCHDPESLFNPCSHSENYVYGVNCPEFQIPHPSANWVSVPVVAIASKNTCVCSKFPHGSGVYRYIGGSISHSKSTQLTYIFVCGTLREF